MSRFTQIMTTFGVAVCLCVSACRQIDYNQNAEEKGFFGLGDPSEADYFKKSPKYLKGHIVQVECCSSTREDEIELEPYDGAPCSYEIDNNKQIVTVKYQPGGRNENKEEITQVVSMKDFNLWNIGNNSNTHKLATYWYQSSFYFLTDKKESQISSLYIRDHWHCKPDAAR